MKATDEEGDFFLKQVKQVVHPLTVDQLMKVTTVTTAYDVGQLA